MSGLRIWLLTCVLAGASGCALFKKSEPLEVRYFSPTPPVTAAAGSESAAPSELRVRVGKIQAASHIDRRIVLRKSELELEYYHDLRWTEAPEEYVRRGLEEVLFEHMGLVQVVSGPAPTLEVELVSFEEVKEPSKHVGRVVLSVSLADERTERFRRTIVSEKPIRSDTPEAAVDALSQALQTSLDQVAHQTTVALNAHQEEIARAREQAEKADAASASAGSPP